MLLHKLVEAKASINPGKVAVVFKSERVTYAELNERATRTALGLLKHGVDRGDIVGVLMPNRIEYLYLALGLWKIGCTVQLLNFHFTDEEIIFALNNVEAKYLISVDKYSKYDYTKRLDNIVSNVPTIKNVFVLGEENIPGVIDFRSLIYEDNSDQLSKYEKISSELSPDDMAFLFYTGGTTGMPKAAIITHYARYSVDKGWGDVLGVDDSDVILVNLPMFHLFVWHTIIRSFISGATLVIMEEYDTQRSLELIEREKVTFLAQVPTMYIYEFKFPELGKYDLSSLRVGLTGGAPFPEELFDDVQEKLGKLRIINFYGLTEDGGVVTLNRLDDDEHRAKRSVGKPIPGVELRVVNEERKTLPTGEVGEVAVKAPWIKGYYNNPKETAKAMDEEGWLYTGDLGLLDEDGYLFFKGRKKDMFITGGENIYPAEIETVILKHPDVVMVAVVGVPHEKLGEVGRAYVVLKEGSKLKESDIIDFCKGKLASIKIPRQVIFRKSLPMTPVGKVKKHVLKEEVLRELKRG